MRRILLYSLILFLILPTVYAINVIDSVTLNSTFDIWANNQFTIFENLTASWATTTTDSETNTNITDWRINGTSIAVLNMPFEGGSNSTRTRDYSTFGNNGTVSGAVWNSTGGYDGKGAYMFDGINDEINASNFGSVNLSINDFTVSARFKASPTNVSGDLLRLVSHRKSPYAGYEIYLANYNGIGCPSMFIGNGTTYAFGCAVTTINATDLRWHQFTVTFNRTGSAFYYFDGVYVGAKSLSTVVGSIGANTNLIVGHYGTSFFNGTIDDVQIYNRLLSSQEILLLYNNRTDIISSKELNVGENWTACITPNDGIEDGATVCSNQVTIRNILNLISFYPNATNQLQNITTEINVSIVKVFNSTLNTTFNVTVYLEDTEPLSFQWFINGVLEFIQSLTSGVTSMFTHFFGAGEYEVTVIVNGSEVALNKTFTWNLMMYDTIPNITSVFINSTYTTNYSNEDLTSYTTYNSATNLTPYEINDWRINGRSLALLNMPFENGSNSTWTRDYSSYGNNGSVINVTWGVNSGYNNRGAYYFDDNSESRINVPGKWELTGEFSYGAKFYALEESTMGIISNYELAPGWGKGFLMYFDGWYIQCRVGNSTNYLSSRAWAKNLNTWYNVMCVYSEGNIYTYLNGVKHTQTFPEDPLVPVAYNNSALQLGVYYTNFTGNPDIAPMYGYIDDVQIYYRALSDEQILFLNLSDNVISNYETETGENWTNCVTSYSLGSVGNTVCSNQITIRERYTVVTIYPNQTYEAINISTEKSINISREYNLSNLTFNISVVSNDELPLTFRWFVNGVLVFIETQTTDFVSFFTHFFENLGYYNVTIVVNGSEFDDEVNKTFTWNLTIVDTVPPYFIETPTNQTIEYGTILYYDINGSDSFFNNYFINDTTHFIINNSGILTNYSLIPVGTWWVNVTINDTSGNQNSSIFTIFVNDTIPPTFNNVYPIPGTEYCPNSSISIGATSIYDLSGVSSYSISLLYPNGTINIYPGNVTFITPYIYGAYYVNLTANDTYNNINITHTNFIVEECLTPAEIINEKCLYTTKKKVVIIGKIPEDRTNEVFITDKASCIISEPYIKGVILG